MKLSNYSYIYIYISAYNSTQDLKNSYINAKHVYYLHAVPYNRNNLRKNFSKFTRKHSQMVIVLRQYKAFWCMLIPTVCHAHFSSKGYQCRSLTKAVCTNAVAIVDTPICNSSIVSFFRSFEYSTQPASI